MRDYLDREQIIAGDTFLYMRESTFGICPQMQAECVCVCVCACVYVCLCALVELMGGYHQEWSMAQFDSTREN